MKNTNILLKKISSNLNDEEEILFKAWLQKSHKNKLLYERLLLLKKEKNVFNKISELDVNVAWESVQAKSNSNREIKPKSLFKKTIIKFSVAASVALMISLSLINRTTDFFNSPSNTSPIVVNNNIVAGSYKAVLTLGDGTLVELKKEEKYETTSASSDGEQIIYKASNKSNDEIQYNYLTIPRGGQFFVKLSDGTQVWLNSETQIKYPVAFIEGHTRQIELVYGEAFFDVSPSKDHNGSAFKVYHSKQEVEVIGTQFNIKAYKDEKNIYTTLVEGKVVINVGSMNQHLLPNQQSNLNLDDNSLKVYTIDSNMEIAWKEGVFNFDNKLLKEIMVVLSRWYDMEVVFENKELEQQKFVGLINKSYNIEDILAVMRDTNIINSYSINDRTITLK